LTQGVGRRFRLPDETDFLLSGFVKNGAGKGARAVWINNFHRNFIEKRKEK